MCLNSMFKNSSGSTRFRVSAYNQLHACTGFISGFCSGGGGQMLSAQILGGGGASGKNQHSACVSTPI